MKSAKILRIFSPLLFSLFIIWLFWQTKISAVKLYPVMMNLLFFSIFFVSCFTKETVIQKIAKKIEGSLNERLKIYTRNITYIWVIFLFFNLLISIYSLFSSDNFWMIYNGCISYLLMGTLFVVEYIIRLLFKRKYNI